MLNKMRDVLAKITRAGVVDDKLITEIARDIQRILITSDVNVALVQQLSRDIEKRAREEKLPPGVSRKEHLIKIIYEKLVDILGGETYSPRMDKHRILLVGLFGSGKTTATGKLAKFYTKRGLKTCIITTDIWRPAAYEQVRQIGEQVKVPTFGSATEKEPVKILKDALGKAKDFDLVIVDSAGRDSLNEELLREIRGIHGLLKPQETYLVISADIGQTAVKQATAFHQAVGLTGVIVTKADASGKAGGALSACHAAKVPVAFVSTGEKVDDFEIFDAQKFTSRLLGFPDLGELLKRVKEAVEETDFSPDDILSGNYNLKTFYKQLEATKKMGPLKKVFEMMGLGAMPEELVATSEKKLGSYKHIMDSMTAAEKEDPSIINSNRIKRIAKGAGKTEADVKEMLKQYEMGRKMLSKLKKGKRLGGPMGQMLKQFKGSGLEA
jgi:signal recognition particle subunit SRP54